MQYSKFMANLYHYDKNIQKEISGVARFETIGKSIKVGVKLCFSKIESGIVKVFLIKKEGRNFLGKMIFEGKMRQRVFSMQKVLIEDDIKSMKIRPDEIKGVCIIFNDNRNFAAFWEADKIDIDKIELIKDDEIQEETARDSKSEIADVKQAENQPEDTVKQADNKQADNKQVDNSQADNIEENIESENDVSSMESIESVNNDSEDITADESKEINDSVDIMFSQGEKANLTMLRNLPKRAWKLGNNSFLLHGYYNYHYIYLKREETRWIVGVPGVFYPQEEKIASIFGFVEFMPISADEKKQGVFGYWCRAVDIS